MLCEELIGCSGWQILHQVNHNLLKIIQQTARKSGVWTTVECWLRCLSRIAWKHATVLSILRYTFSKMPNFKDFIKFEKNRYYRWQLRTPIVAPSILPPWPNCATMEATGGTFQPGWLAALACLFGIILKSHRFLESFERNFKPEASCG